MKQEIDWTAQWEAFAPSFQEGRVCFNLNEIGGPDKSLFLKPGGGFGDLSHPTTKVALELMAGHVPKTTVFDIGCGSGILSIAALLLGAERVIGIDIEDDAIIHSRENAALNALENCTFGKKVNAIPHGKHLILMNMISSEQEVAWQQNPLLHDIQAVIITSGVLASQKEQYLALTKGWSWHCEEVREKDGWLGFVFKTKGH